VNAATRVVARGLGERDPKAQSVRLRPAPHTLRKETRCACRTETSWETEDRRRKETAAHQEVRRRFALATQGNGAEKEALRDLGMGPAAGLRS